MAFNKKKKKREREMMEHFQDGDEVVIPSLLCHCFIRFDIWAYSLEQRVNKWPLQCLYPVSLH